MIKNAQNSPQKSTRSELSSLAPVLRQQPQGETGETVKMEPRRVRSLGPIRSTKALQVKSGKTEKKPHVIIKKGTREAGLLLPSGGPSPAGVKFNSVESTGRAASEQGRATTPKTGAPAPREAGLSKKGGRDLRSLLSVTNPERSFISAQNLPFLRRFVTEQGKILSRRLTRVTARQQREITKAIKQARILGYLQFVNTK